MPFFLKSLSRSFHLSAILMLVVLTDAYADVPNEGQWKTAYYKRGFVGNYQAQWAGGTNSTLRMRIPVPFDGSKVRVTLAPMHAEETALSKLSLAKAKDNNGTIEDSSWPLRFADVPNVKLAAKQTDVVSDALDIPIKSGNWYLQSSYSSDKFLYAYGVDGYFNGAGDQHNVPNLTDFKAGTWAGNIYRVEVFTTDTRPIILCYGDSITNGFTSTPNAGNSYPEILGQLTKTPTLNLGVNGDLFSYVGGAPSLIKSCNGVESVIVLMGINDIISGKIANTDEYTKIAANLIGTLKQSGKKVYFGTITPSGGYAAFDKDAAKETLRQSINSWIRQHSKVDAVIDFDTALADPNNPSRMRADYQSDWLHPNDAGYRKMAETAAKFFS